MPFFTYTCQSLDQAQQFFNRFCVTNFKDAKVEEVWETNEADWCELMLYDKEIV
jgi:hypothetical protein